MHVNSFSILAANCHCPTHIARVAQLDLHLCCLHTAKPDFPVVFQIFAMCVLFVLLQAMKIHVSETTRVELLDYPYVVTERATIAVKVIIHNAIFHVCILTSS